MTKREPLFRVGDKVKTDFYPEASNVVRKITSVDLITTPRGYRYLISMDDGGECSHCGNKCSSPIMFVPEALAKRV